MRILPKILAFVLMVFSAAVCHGALDCSGMIEIELNSIQAGDNTGLPNNVTTYGCSDWDESGGEVVYHLFLATPTRFEVRLESVCDLDLAILGDCDESLGCIEVTDNGATTTSPQQGDFYFVVDGYEAAACAFQLFVNDIGVANETRTFGEIKTMFR